MGMRSKTNERTKKKQSNKQINRITKNRRDAISLFFCPFRSMLLRNLEWIDEWIILLFFACVCVFFSLYSLSIHFMSMANRPLRLFYFEFKTHSFLKLLLCSQYQYFFTCAASIFHCPFLSLFRSSFCARLLARLTCLSSSSSSSSANQFQWFMHQMKR